MTFTQTQDQSQVIKVIMHYKKFYLSLGIIFVCILLIFFVIIPQMQNYGQQQEEISEVKSRIATLQNNISLLSQSNEQEQEKQFATVLAALPEEKDYAGILFAVRNASAKTGVGLGDFTFQVGELSPKAVITRKLPTISLTLHVIGSPGDVAKFIQELSQSLPLSNVTQVSMNTNSSDIVVDFYYKPVPQLQVNYTQPLVDPATRNKKVVEDLQKWSSSSPQSAFDSLIPLEGSASASPFGL